MKSILLGLLVVPALAGAWVFGCGGKDTQGGGGSGGSSTATSNGGNSPTSTGTGGRGGGGGGGGPPSCETEAWSTYGHDGQRTFASNGCVDGPLQAAWHYVPTPPSGRTFNFVEQAIASSDAAYLNWAASDEGYTGTTAVDKVSKAGARVWTWDSGTDSNLGDWLSLAVSWNQVIVNDDGFTVLKDADGTVDGSNGVDWWGQTIATDDRVFMVNNEHVDGPGIFVGAFDKTRKAIWQDNQFGSCRIDAGDATGGIALDGNVLFYAPSYSFGMGPAPSFTSGVYAFAGAHGKQKWFKPTTPLSTISVGSGNVYLIEAGTAAMPTLVARAEADGTVAWQVPFTSAGSQAPVLAAGLVIVAHDSMVLSAYDQATGKKKWDAMVTGAQTFSTPLTFSGGCHNDAVPTVQNPRTSLAAALASSTLVVAAADKLHILDLVTGKEKWSGAPTATTPPYRDPVIVGSTVYVMDQTGLARLDAK